jgi:hypothetical protein
VKALKEIAVATAHLQLDNLTRANDREGSGGFDAQAIGG